jgi:hypothetical protein
VTKADYPNDLGKESQREIDAAPDPLCRGGSAIISPLGEYLAGPLWDEAGILYATIDPGEIAEARFDFDAVGHYSRPDLFRLTAPSGASLGALTPQEEMGMIGDLLFGGPGFPGLIPPLDEEDLAELDEIMGPDDAAPFLPAFPASWREKKPGAPSATRLPAKPTKRRRRGK